MLSDSLIWKICLIPPPQKKKKYVNKNNKDILFLAFNAIILLALQVLWVKNY